MILNKLKNLELNSIDRNIPILGSEKAKLILEIINKEKPKKILELGTANGYSGIVLAYNGAKLTTIEKNKELVQEAIKNFNKFNIDYKIIIGDVLEELKNLDDKYDLIFIDFAKKKYIKAISYCIKLLNKNGTIITDDINMDLCKDCKKYLLKNLKTKINPEKNGLAFSKFKSKVL